VAGGIAGDGAGLRERFVDTMSTVLVEGPVVSLVRSGIMAASQGDRPEAITAPRGLVVRCDNGRIHEILTQRIHHV
jgi:hypothetical protein